jgi:hypothetical protein
MSSPESYAPVPAPRDIDPTDDSEPTLETTDLTDNEATVDTETVVDTREVSPTGSKVVRAAERINAFLERRAINKAHGQANKENAQRDKAAQDEAYDSYSDNIATTADRESLEADWAAADDARMNELHAEANKENKNIDKAARKAERDQAIERAKEKLRGFGARALNVAKAGGNLVLGAGILTGEAAARGAQAAGQRGADAYSSAKAKAGETVDAARGYVDSKVDSINNAAESFNQKTEAVAEKIKGTPDQVKAWWKDRKEKATVKKAEKDQARSERKQAREDRYAEKIKTRNEKRVESVRKAEAARAARRAKWATRGNNAKEYVGDKAGNIRDTMNTKKAAVGTFAGRVIAAGKAAHGAGKESWESSRP